MSAPPLSREQLRAAIEQATRDLPPHERVAVAERVAREVSRRQRRTRFASPGALAHKIDPLVTVETPMLRVLDRELVRAAEELSAGRPVRLGVFAPPQEGKSRRTTMAFPLWLLVRYPHLRIGIASFESEIASEFSSPIRNWIQEHGSGTPLNPRSLDDDLLGITLRFDSTSKSRFGLAGHPGGVIALGMKGGWTGRPVDVLIVDDPYKNREVADSPKHRKTVQDWLQNVALPRLPSASLVIVVQTRWHPDDLAGYLIRSEQALPREDRLWRFVNVPAQAERPPKDPDEQRGWLPDSLRRKPGEYLRSARGRTPTDWARQRAAVGEMVWGSLYQQHPTPPTGAVFSYEHITRNRRPADWETPRSRTAVAVDTSAGGQDEAGIIGGYRGTDGRAYITHDRSGAMSSAQWARRAWLLVLDTGADDLVWEANLAPGTMRDALRDAWARIVRQVRTLSGFTDPQPDPFTGRTDSALDLTRPEVRSEVLHRAAQVWAAQEQRLPITEVEASQDDEKELAEVYDRMQSGLLTGVLDSTPARLVPVHASEGKRIRATPVATAYETNKVSHVGVLPELEQEQTQWQEGAASPGRLDADVWLVTHLLGVRRSRTTTAAATTLPGVGSPR